jgi:threonine synthase
MAAVRETNGAFVQVSDEAILAAVPRLAQGCGVFAEPAGAAAFAGLLSAVNTGLVSKDERVVVVNTGNGLKDVAGAMRAVEMVGKRPLRVSPDFEAFKRLLPPNEFGG